MGEEPSGRLLTNEATTDGAPVLDIRGVSASYGNVQVIDGLDLQLRPGELLALLGPSGSGKSTILNLIAGFLEPTAGTITMEGRDLVAVPPYKRKIGVIFQGYALFPHMSVFDNVGFGLRTQRETKEAIRERVRETLSIVDMDTFGPRMPGRLSGGEQQRVALARSLATRPKLLLLDEPFANLDANLRSRIRIQTRLLLRELGVPAILVTHDQQEAMDFADRIAVLNLGQLCQVDSSREIYERPTDAFVAEFVGQPNRLSVRVTDCQQGSREAAWLVSATLEDGTVVQGRSQVELPVGVGAHAFVRPEDVRVDRARQQFEPGTSVVGARILDKLFRGSFIEVIASVGEGLRCEFSRREASSLEIGQDVTVSWHWSESPIFPISDDELPW